MAENVKVAVRVRPFNQRENTRNATLVINMEGNKTEIRDPANLQAAPKIFNFDFSYWSHDGYTTRPDGYMEPEGSKYADQKKVFMDLGQGVLANAWKGFNCSLFAYGQTGSGKTYSMVGYNTNRGIIPMFCDELFKGIAEKRATASSKDAYEVTVSMLEIYNEMARDLLNKDTLKQKGLKIKSDPKRGFYVDSLTTALVNSYPEIERKTNEGTKNRTVASTNMNATSSRAHTIVAINFKQVTVDSNGTSMTRTSIINLVDLAGSERVASTGATGDRLTEGKNINQSLSTLGNVINALASGNGKKFVPYRDSVLTKLLKNALGGNSKTVMIAALSPADINYSETLSTLRFADRAKAIKTTATVNENPTDRLIRELREENARLLKLLQEGGISTTAQGEGGGGEEMRSLEEQLQQNQKEMEAMKTSWQQRLEEAQREHNMKQEEERKLEEKKQITPHFWNLNEDPALNAMVIHFCDKGKAIIGSKKADSEGDICLSGLGIQPNHAEIVNKEGAVFVVPIDTAKVTVNGQKILAQTRLRHHDRLLFGANALYVYHDPIEATKLAQSGGKTLPPSFDDAQEEIALMSGLVSKDGTSKDDLILQDEVAQVLRIVNEANAMSEEMDKKVKFEVALLSAAFRSLNRGPTEVRMKVKNLTTGNQWLWTKDKAIHRHSLMQQHYQDFITRDENWHVPKESDPFWEPADSEVLIGISQQHLVSLAHKCSFEETVDIHDYKSQIKGYLQIEMIPCDSSNNPLDDSDLLEDPSELVGRELRFIFKINAVGGLPPNIEKVFCRYKFYLDGNYTETGEVSASNPKIKFEHTYSQTPVTQQFLNYLKERLLIIEVWGRQKDEDAPPSQGKGGLLTTKDLMVREKTFLGKSALESGEGGEKKKKKKKKKHRTEENGVVLPVPVLPQLGRENLSTMTKDEEQQLKQELENYKAKEKQLQQEQENGKAGYNQLKQEIEEYRRKHNRMQQDIEGYQAQQNQMKQEIEGYKSKGRQLQQECMGYRKSVENVKDFIRRNKESGKSSVNVSALEKVLEGSSEVDGDTSGANSSKACVIQ